VFFAALCDTFLERTSKIIFPHPGIDSNTALQRSFFINNIFVFPTKKRRTQSTNNQFRNFLCALCGFVGYLFRKNLENYFPHPGIDSNTALQRSFFINNIFVFPTKTQRTQSTNNQFRNFLCALSDLAGYCG
jgi:CRISPR/Cas system-associated protein endoribonuclease Cas2